MPDWMRALRGRVWETVGGNLYYDRLSPGACRANMQVVQRSGSKTGSPRGSQMYLTGSEEILLDDDE